MIGQLQHYLHLFGIWDSISNLMARASV